MAIYHKKEFEAWLVENGFDCSYARYIDVVRNDILKEMGCDWLIDDIGKIIIDKTHQPRLIPSLQELDTFMTEIVTYADNGFYKAERILLNHTMDYYKKCNFALKKYIEYLNSIIPNIATRQNKYKIAYWNNAIDLLRYRRNKLCSERRYYLCFNDCYIDNYMVRNIIERCYFFNLFSKQGENSNEYCSLISGIKRTYSYKQTLDEQDKMQQEEKLIEVIRNHSGYDLKDGQTGIFADYKVHYIWEKEFGDNYGTCLWNVVLVPACLSLLFENNAETDELALKLINTLRAVSIKLIEKQSSSKSDKAWIICEEMKPAKKYIVKGDYAINVINPRQGDMFKGEFTREKIKITLPNHKAINRSLFGFVLGKTTRQQMKEIFGKRNWYYQEDKNVVSIYVRDMQCCGRRWGYVDFLFDGNEILSSFVFTNNKKPFAEMYQIYEKASQSLYSNHGAFFVNESREKYINNVIEELFDDEMTTAQLSLYFCADSSECFMKLKFSDNPPKKPMKSEEDRLAEMKRLQELVPDIEAEYGDGGDDD